MKPEGGVDWSAVVDATVALGAVAISTERIRFGALVTAVARLRPEVFASQTATLDRLSDGRLIVGVGLGSPDTPFSAFGLETDLRVRAAMTDEFLGLVAELWSGAEVGLSGRFYSATDVALSPVPLQTPRIPVWIGADSGRRAPRRRGARWDGFVPASDRWPEGVVSVQDCGVIAAEIRALRADGDPFDLVLIGDADGTSPGPSEIPGYAAAGVTWMLAQALTPAEARRRIADGPPRV